MKKSLSFSTISLFYLFQIEPFSHEEESNSELNCSLLALIEKLHIYCILCVCENVLKLKGFIIIELILYLQRVRTYPGIHQLIEHAWVSSLCLGCSSTFILEI